MMRLKSSTFFLGLALAQAFRLHAEEAAPTPSPLFYADPALKVDSAKPFGFHVEYGQNTSAGKSSYRTRNANLGIKYENGVDEVQLDGHSTYLKTSEKLVDDKDHIYFGYDRYIGARFWLFVLNDWESNQAAGLNYTQLTGGGVKYDILRNSAYKLNVGVAYLKRAKQTQYKAKAVDGNGVPYDDIIKNTRDDQVVSARLKFTYNVEPTRFSLISFYQPTLNKEVDPISGKEKADYSWSTEASLTHNINKRTYLKFSYTYRFESLQASPGSPRNDEKTAVLLGYEL